MGLRKLTQDAELADALAANFQTAPVSEADKAMLRYVEKLTRTTAEMVREDVGALRQAGFSDGAILDICQVTSYYAFVNRLASGLGVELESPRGTT